MDETETRSVLHPGKEERDDCLEPGAVADISLVSAVRARGRSGRPRPRRRRNRWPNRPRSLGQHLGRARAGVSRDHALRQGLEFKAMIVMGCDEDKLPLRVRVKARRVSSWRTFTKPIAGHDRPLGK